MTTTSSDTGQPLDRYIDRFLFAEGWRVTGVEPDATTGLFAVTITRGDGQTVTRSASSAGEATFMACSSARALVSLSS